MIILKMIVITTIYKNFGKYSEQDTKTYIKNLKFIKKKIMMFDDNGYLRLGKRNTVKTISKQQSSSSALGEVMNLGSTSKREY